MNISNLFESVKQQQLPALVTILEKAKQFAHDNDVSELELIERRLIDDMHPLRWQVQTVLELTLRSAARLSEQDMPSLELTDTDFDGLISRVRETLADLSAQDLSVMDGNADKQFDIPIGPDAHITLSGQSYALGFYQPNFFFHLTTAYNLLRQAGVPLGKRDFMGPLI